MMENGQALTGAHSTHEDIRVHGSGRYSHWGRQLLFSSSDSSDPRMNGRSYSAQIVGSLSPTFWMTVAAFIAGFGIRGLLLLRGRFRQFERIEDIVGLTIAILCAGVSVYDIWAVTGFMPILTPDSGTYLSMPHIRGYPVKLLAELGIALGAGAWWIVFWQLAFFVAAAFLLGWSTGKLLNAPWAGWLLTATIVTNSHLLSYTHFLMSEATFIVLVMCFTAFGMRAILKQKMSDLVLCAIAAALAILIRPAAYALGVGLIALLIAVRPWKIRQTLASLATFAMVISAGAMPNLITYGVFSTHMIGGAALIGHVIHFADKDAPYKDPKFADAMIDSVAGISTAASARYPEEYWHVTTNEYNKLLWGTMAPRARQFLEERANARGLALSPAALEGQIDTGFRQVATTIILDHPMEYVRHVAAHVYGMWVITFQQQAVNRQNWTQSTTDVFTYNPDIVRMVKSNPYPSNETAQIWNRAADRRTTADFLTYQVLAVLGVLLLPVAIGSVAIAIWALVLLVRRRPLPSPVSAAAFLSVLLWAYIGVVAAAQPALHRYAVANFVLILPLVWIGAYGLSIGGRKVIEAANKHWRPGKTSSSSPDNGPKDKKSIEQEHGTPIA